MNPKTKTHPTPMNSSPPASAMPFCARYGSPDNSYRLRTDDQLLSEAEHLIRTSIVHPLWEEMTHRLELATEYVADLEKNNDEFYKQVTDLQDRVAELAKLEKNNVADLLAKLDKNSDELYEQVTDLQELVADLLAKLEKNNDEFHEQATDLQTRVADLGDELAKLEKRLAS